MTIKTFLVAGLAAAALCTVALPASAHCKCACEKGAVHKTVKAAHTKAKAVKAKVTKSKVTKVKAVKTKTVVKTKTIIKTRTVIVEKPVVVERVVVVQAPPRPSSDAVYVGGVWCKKTVKVTYHRQSGGSTYRSSGRHYEGWRADRGDYGHRQVAYAEGW